MDEEERKQKLEAGKAKLASYRKKRSSLSKKKKKSSSPLDTTPRDGSHSEEVGAGDSTAVQTGDDSSLRALSPSDESDRSTTTAEEISTEEEAAYPHELSQTERIQELETRVHDQMVALQNLTVENKQLRNNSQVTVLESSISEKDDIISELRSSISQTAEQICQLQQQLTKATDAVMDSGGEQDQIVTELTETRTKLDEYQNAIGKQEETMQAMAKKLAEKSMEALESSEKCKSLQSELERSRSLLVSSEENASAALRSLHEDVDKEKSSIQAELEEQHGRQIAAIKLEHQKELKRQMEHGRGNQGPAGTYDPEDIRAFREQVAMLSSQLETSYRDLDKMKRDHDKEVIQLNQQLVSAVDEYETKLQDERIQIEDLEHRLEMSDTVSSEIQASFSKQLEQLEEERDALRQQLRQSQVRAKENAASKKQIKDLEDEVVSYQTELANTTQRLEDAEKQRRHLRDEVERLQEASEKRNEEKSASEAEFEAMQSSALQLQQNIKDLEQEHKSSVEDFEKKIANLNEWISQEKKSSEDKLQEVKTEHSEELKHLHSQHHRQMDEIKQDMERQLNATKAELDEERKNQLETVKDVHERSRDREMTRLIEEHKAELEKLQESHASELEALRLESQEVKTFAEERLQLELKEEFQNRLENELSLLRRSLEQENELALAELESKHSEDLSKLKAEQSSDMENSLKEHQLEHEAALQTQKKEMDSAIEALNEQHKAAQETLQAEHTEALAKLEDELESSEKRKESDEAQATTMLEAKDALQAAVDNNESLKQEIQTLQANIAEVENLLAAEKEQSKIQGAELDSLREKIAQDDATMTEIKQDMDAVKEELATVQTERDQIFSHAEESRKRLASNYHDETSRFREELEQAKMEHQNIVESMQIEIESLRTSRTDLQDLKSQLLARNASVQDLEKLREEFGEEKEALIKDHEEELEKLRLAHEEDARSYEEKLQQVTSDLDDANEKLAEVCASPVMMGSSPLRSVSALSDYDSSNVHALNKDYRSAMTLTHVSGVSGLSESPGRCKEEPMTLDAEAREEDEGKPSEEDLLREQLDEMKRALTEVQEEIASMKMSHETELQSLKEEHAILLEKALQAREAEKCDAIDAINEEHEKALNEFKLIEKEALEKLQEAHRHEITQIRLQCASETAKQVEDETEQLSKQLRESHEDEINSIKQKLKAEATEKLEEERKGHEQELQKQSEEMSAAMESRLSAVMSELHDQKQQSLVQMTSEHSEEIKRLQSELDDKLQEVKKREEDLTDAWNKRREELEQEVETLKADLTKSKELYLKLTDDLDCGNNEHLRTLQANHLDELEAQRKRLEEEHEVRQEAALKKQAQIYQQAQEDFIKLHQAQLEQFTTAEKEEAELRDKEVSQRIHESTQSLKDQFDEEKSALIAAHDEDIKTVSTKLVEVLDKNQQLEESKNQLSLLLDTWQVEKEKEMSDLKTTLVNQHMQKFQEVTVTLEQHHKQEIDNLVESHGEREANLREELDALQKRVELAVDEHNQEMEEMKEDYKDHVKPEDFEAHVKKLVEEHENKLMAEKQAHDELLQQIEQEIQVQQEGHKEGTKKILETQGGELEILQKQFDEALKNATESSGEETQKLEQRIVELEEQLQEADQLRNEMEELRAGREKLEAVVAEQESRAETWRLEQNEEREAYEKKLQELSDALSASKEDYQDLNSRIEFERAEYEAEIESAQEELRVKEENFKEFEAEIEHKTQALESMQKQYEQLTSRRERETQEGDNLLKMLRDDLDRINKERDAIGSSNEQLLLTLTELVRANQRCEEVIGRRLEALPIGSGENDNGAEANLTQSTASNADSDSTATPSATSLSGSFVDEGLEVSQRLSESMFAGPDLDSTAREVVTSTGARVGQAVERLLDMLNNTILQLNAAQQAQTLLGDELQRVVEAKSATEQPADQAKKQTERILQLERQLSETEEALALVQQQTSNDLTDREARLAEEKSLLQKQREALVEGRDATELNLLRATEELASEKQLLVELHRKERDHLEEAARQLEEAMEESTKNGQEREGAYLAQIDDLNSQITALSKQNESDNRFNAELVTDREEEREHFEQMMEKMRSEIDEARETAKSEALLAEKVAHLEEDLDSRQQQQQESQQRIEELQLKIKQQNEIIEELKAQPSNEQEIEALKAESSAARSESEESKRQHDVIQQELYANMLRISELEAKLDRYRHGVDEESIAARERAEAAERHQAEQKMEDLEEKENQIELLVEQQHTIHNQVIEKEEQVEQLLCELDQMKDLEAENAKIKEELEELHRKVNDTSQPQAGQTEQFEALSRQLLDEKNAEIDELRQHLALLRSETTDGDEAASEMLLSSLQTQLREVITENEELREKLRTAEAQLHGALQESDVVVEEAVVVAGKDESSAATDDGDTGIQEVDLTTGDLSRGDELNRLHQLENENSNLREELEAVEARAKELLSEVERNLFRIAPETKEKIRDLEERLEKERDDLERTFSSSSSSSDGSATDDVSDNEKTDSSKNSSFAKEEKDEVRETTRIEDSKLVREKLMEIEKELRNGTPNVFTRILSCKEEELLAQKEIIDRLEIELQKMKDEVISLQRQVADLQLGDNGPDVQIRMRSDDGDAQEEKDHELDVRVEQQPLKAPFEEDRDDLLDASDNQSTKNEDSSSESETSDHSDRPDELKISLDAEEREVINSDVILIEKEKLLEEKETVLQELTEKYESVCRQCQDMEEKLETLAFEFDEYKQNHPDEQSEVDDETNLREEVELLTKKTSAAQEERNRVMSQLNDVQRECAALLEDNHRLEVENRKVTEDATCHSSKMQDLEDLITERENELQQAQLDTSELQQQVTELANDLQVMQTVVDNATELKFKLEEEIRNMSADHKSVVINMQNEIKRLSTAQNVEIKINGSGDAPPKASQDEGVDLYKSPIFDGEMQKQRLRNEVDDLQEELQNVTFKNKELGAELESLKQSHAEEMQSIRSQHEVELSAMRQKLDESPAIEPQVVDEQLQTSNAALTRASSTSSSSSDEDLQTKMDELREEHQRKMEEIQQKFSQELQDAVDAATKIQEERNEALISELEEKHKKEMADIVTESMTVDNELAKRLRDELDLADKLDNNLINQLSAIAPMDSDSLNSSSPTKDADLSSRLQQLLSRLHNEGVQVLSLSELQFIKEHQDFLNASAQTGLEPEEVEAKSVVDVEALKRAWSNEKLALLDAIQSLKELLTQTATEVAQSCDEDDDDLRWRSDLLRAVADLFECERRALLAELQASVVEAHGEAEANGEISTASRLEELERKLRSQEAHHRGELERLLAADRDQLVDDFKLLKSDKKEQHEQAQERIRELQEQNKNVEESSRQSQAVLKQQLECMKSRLLQEQAVTEDLRSSFETERLRSRDVLPSLQRERERTCELSAEIAAVTERATEESTAANQRIDALKYEIENREQKLEELESKVKELQEENSEKEKTLHEERKSNGDEKSRDAEVIADLQAALASEEKRRLEAVAAVEAEKQNVSRLHQELANERATAYEDVLTLKNRCDDLSAAVVAEKRRCEELQDALEREAVLTRQVREALESERADAAEAREHDRATVADLQSILEKARRDTDRIQRRVDSAEQEKAAVLREAGERQREVARKLEQERASRDEAVVTERRARSELQTALQVEEARKQDAERRIRELEDRQQEILKRQEEEKGSVPDQQDLLAHRRLLESLRQRLQLEAAKFQNLIDGTARRTSPRDLSAAFATSESPSVSLLSSDGEKLESLKRSLRDMQSELKDLYGSLSMPDRADSRKLNPANFNDQLLRHNAELSDYAAQAARDAGDLRELITELEEEKRKARPLENGARMSQAPTQENQQKLASRLHKVYTRYLRAESFRKSLVYQKKYLLLLLGGFQDCEEATLALIARMGAYPSDDSLRRPIPHRSEAFTRFRSAVRVVIAVTRMKFSVRKWKRASTTVSTAIQNKHGVPVNGSTSMNETTTPRQPTRLHNDMSASSYASHHPRTPSPHLDGSISPAYGLRTSDPYSYASRYSAEFPVHDAYRAERHLPGTSQYSAGAGRSSHRASYDGDLSSESRRLSPAAAAAYASLDRSKPAESDPSLNEYIRKLENIQHKLGQGSYRYPR